MACKVTKSFAKMDSRKKSLLTGIIYFLLLCFGTFCFQKIEKEAAVERCDRFVQFLKIVMRTCVQVQKIRRKNSKTIWSARVSIGSTTMAKFVTISDWCLIM